MTNDVLTPDESQVTLGGMTRITSYLESIEIMRSAEFYSPLHYRSSYPVVGTSILSLYGDAHTQRRRMDLPVVARTALMKYEFDTTLPIIREKLALAEGQQSKKLDLVDVMTPAVVSVAAQVIGLDIARIEGAIAKLTDIGGRVSTGVTAEWTLLPVEPAIRDALQARSEFEELFYLPSRKRREQLVAAWRRGEIPESDIPNDIIGLFLRHVEKLTDDAAEALVRECLFWLTASTDTTIHSSAHAFMEIHNWLKANPHDRPLFDDLAFLQRGVAEAIRLHPPLPSAMRRALTTVTLSTGRVIREGEYLDLDLNAIDRDVEFFGADADQFNPHRTDHSAQRVFGASFGSGVHSCLGRRLAVGAGNGRVEGQDAPVGLAVRLVECLLAANAQLLPDDPPTLRSGSTNGRWDRFPIVVRKGVGK